MRSPHRVGVQLELGPSDTNDDIPTDHTNLAFIAAEKLMVRAGRSGHGVRLVLRKRIPAGAGLGGGSADAAAALLAVRRLLEMDVDDDGVREIAAEVGSDVPFCLTGGAAWMRGRGEIIEPLDLTRGLAFLVAIPPFRLVDPRRVRDVGRSSVGRPRSGRCPRRAGSRGWCPTWPTTSSPRPKRSSRGSWSSGPRSKPPSDGPRCSQGVAPPTSCPWPTRACCPTSCQQVGQRTAGAGRRYHERVAWCAARPLGATRSESRAG